MLEENEWTKDCTLSASIDPHPWWAHWRPIFIPSVYSIVEVYCKQILFLFPLWKNVIISRIKNLDIFITEFILKELDINRAKIRNEKRSFWALLFPFLPAAWEQYTHTHTHTHTHSETEIKKETSPALQLSFKKGFPSIPPRYVRSLQYPTITKALITIRRSLNGAGSYCLLWGWWGNK